jgi:hypothetical protein
LFSKGELFLNNVEYIGPYNIKADGTYHTLSKFIEGKSKELKTKKSTLYQDLLKITGGIDVSEKNGQVVDNTILPTNEDYTKQGYEVEGIEKATAVKYIKRDKETDKIISRKFQINPENYSTYSSRISTTLSLEGLANLFQLNADDLSLEAYNEIKSENERFRFLSALEKIFSESEFTNSDGEKKSISFIKKIYGFSI